MYICLEVVAVAKIDTLVIVCVTTRNLYKIGSFFHASSLCWSTQLHHELKVCCIEKKLYFKAVEVTMNSR